MSYTVHQAKTNLSRLIKEAEKGTEVIITRGKKPVAKLVPIASASKKRIPDMLKGQIWSAPDAFDPLTDEELRELGFE
jgi:prevent-host-death family protein